MTTKTKPTRFPKGLSTRPNNRLMSNYPLPDFVKTGNRKGIRVATFLNDYYDLGSNASRTITGAGSTFTLVDGVGGIGLLTPGGATVATSAYRTSAAWQFQLGNQLWNSSSFSISNATNGASAYFGLIKSGGVTTDSLLFVKAANSGNVSLVSTVNNVATTLVSNLATLASGVFVEGGFYYDGTDLQVFVNGVLLARVANCTIGASGTTRTNAILTPIVQITPVATETISVDYVMVAQELTSTGV